MKYLLMMHAPRGTGDYEIYTWNPEDRKAHLEHLDAMNQDLRERGEWVEVRALAPPREARWVRAGHDGMPVTDGPFPESREFLAGYWLVEVESEDRAFELASRASMAPGPGGAPLRMPIEVRRLMG